ncbi:hypothetical protein TcasGA2_TC033197 [Tribolium castaneum]|uniref:Uncharacterized protein n=1 Tax=Tribolium castaneum TaxID=7070 RepID=A0A139WH57_TRICA|nr:hypothetical protein TcasGA2_TC033197 [Tribolium castaneum]
MNDNSLLLLVYCLTEAFHFSPKCKCEKCTVHGKYSSNNNFRIDGMAPSGLNIACLLLLHWASLYDSGTPFGRKIVQHATESIPKQVPSSCRSISII